MEICVGNIAVVTIDIVVVVGIMDIVETVVVNITSKSAISIVGLSSLKRTFLYPQ